MVMVLYTANAYSAKPEMSASTCTHSMAGLNYWLTQNWLVRLWHQRVSIKWPLLPPKEFGGGWRKDEARPVAGVSALSFPQCWTLLVGWHKGYLAHKKSVRLIPRCSFPEQGKKENQGGLADPG